MSELSLAIPRFQSKVMINVETGCWLWTARQNSNGYGWFRRPSDQREVMAHRYAYEALVGPIPEGLKMDHLCRVRHCVNPDHLEPVTQRVNLLRGDTLTAREAVATHCPADHPYAGENLYVTPKGDRRCRACHRSRVAAKKAGARLLALPFADHPDYRAEEWAP